MSFLEEELERKYGGITITVVTKSGVELKGKIYGDEECFDGDKFYQFFITEESGCLLKLYYDVSDIHHDKIDFEKPIDIIAVDIKELF